MLTFRESQGINTYPEEFFSISLSPLYVLALLKRPTSQRKEQTTQSKHSSLQHFTLHVIGQVCPGAVQERLCLKGFMSFKSRKCASFCCLIVKTCGLRWIYLDVCVSF